MFFKKIISTSITFFSLSAFSATDYACVGTEPFWSLNLIKDKVILNDYSKKVNHTLDVTSRTSATGTSNDYAFVVTTKYSTLTFLQGSCNDGMSDIEYSHHVIYKNGSNVLYGCCNKY